MKKRWLCLLLALVMVLPLLAACGGGGAKTIKAGKLVLGTSPDYPPYEFPLVGEDGNMQVVGFDVEIARIIAKDMGLELEIQAMDFDSLLAALQSGNIDLVLSGMTPDSERAKAVDFSKIYYYAEQAMIVREGDAGALTSPEAFVGKRVGAQTGSIQEGIANEMEGAEVISLKQVPTLVMELKTGKVDGVVMEKPVADNYVKQSGSGLKLAYTIPNPEGEEGVAVALKKGSKDMLDAVNKTLDRIMNDGTVDKLFNEAIELQEKAEE